MRPVTLGLTLWILCAASGLAQAPAKVVLHVDKIPAEPLDLAVFDPGASSFDRPLVFVHGVSPSGVEIPTGDLLVVLRAGLNAPDFHRLKARAGAPSHLEYRPLQGWSLFVRVRDARTRLPVASAVVSLGPSRQDTTGADGLALFSGIAGGAVLAEVRHPDFVRQTVPDVSAVPGGLAFRDVELEAGGLLSARVRRKEGPMAGALCQFYPLDQPPVQIGPPQVPTDAQGVCRAGRVLAGRYRIDVSAPGSTTLLSRDITLVDGKDLQEDISLSEVRVHGTVTRGGSPVPGLPVRFERRGEGLEGDPVIALTKTGPDGTYALTLPKPGPYTASLFPNPKSPAALERAVALKEGDQVVDFTLQRIVIEGAIVDPQDNPIPGAWVRLHWNDEPELTQRTGKHGEYTFFLDATGQGVLTAGKEGYRDAPVQEIEVDEDDPQPVPLVLVLNKEGASPEGENPEEESPP
jgi:Carboxypeptidase regulatory-like domain